MKNFVRRLLSAGFICLAFFFQESGMAQNAESTVVMSFNIRLNLPSDSSNSWPNRKQMAFNLVRFYQPDIMGLQEVLADQRLDFESELNEFAYVGSGREDGLSKGEAAVIGFLKRRYDLVQSGHFFLSETPEKPSLGWDASFVRPTIWAKVFDKQTKSEILIINVHFDNTGKKARSESGKMIADFISKNRKNAKVIVTGDFNTDLQSGELNGLVNSQVKPVQNFSVPVNYGPSWSFHAFGKYQLSERKLIDYIFLSEEWSVKRLGVLTDNWENKWSSDHCPVLAEIQ